MNPMLTTQFMFKLYIAPKAFTKTPDFTSIATPSTTSRRPISKLYFSPEVRVVSYYVNAKKDYWFHKFENFCFTF